MSEKHLLLYLDAPMQAWGHSSRFNRRTSASWPTKSGVIGMLCAALGVERDDERGISQLAALNVQVYTLNNSGQRLMDYHTVGGGYDIAKEAGQYFGNKNGASIAVLTDREYLLDCKFGVLLSGESAVVEKCAAALENPKWGVWFGRKCCLPAERICEGVFNSGAEALDHLKALAEEKQLQTTGWRIIGEANAFGEGTDSLMDTPLNFKSRRYQTRRIAESFRE